MWLQPGTDLVHVVVASTGLVANPDAEVLDGRGLALENLRRERQQQTHESVASLPMCDEPQAVVAVNTTPLHRNYIDTLLPPAPTDLVH